MDRPVDRPWGRVGRGTQKAARVRRHTTADAVRIPPASDPADPAIPSPGSRPGARARRRPLRHNPRTANRELPRTPPNSSL